MGDTRQASTLDDKSIRQHETPNPANCTYGIPDLKATQYNINPTLIQMLCNSAFEGDIEREDPHIHLERFIQLCGTFRINGVTADTIFLNMFPFSLRGYALDWFKQLQADTLATWKALSTAFLLKFFPPDKTLQMRALILGFKLKAGENLYQAWERFKGLIRKCPHHGIEPWMLISTFYGAMEPSLRISLDVAAQGDFKGMNADDAMALLEKLAMNNYSWNHEQSTPQRSYNIHELDAITMMTKKIDDLSRQFNSYSSNMSVISQQPICDHCKGNHLSEECNFIGQIAYLQGKQSWPISNNVTYNPYQRPNNNLAYSGNFMENPSQPTLSRCGNQSGTTNLKTSQNFQSTEKNQNEPASWESALEKMIQATSTKFEQMEKKFDLQDSKIDQLTTSQKFIEMQLGQIAQAVGARPQGSLPSQPEPYIKEQCKSITLRNGRELPEVETQKPKRQVISKEAIAKQDNEDIQEKLDVESKTDDEVIHKVPVKPYVPPIPFPKRLTNRKLEQQYEKFLEVFRQLHINIPFADALAQMPMYVKFLKEMLSNKTKIEDVETITLNAECSAVIQHSVPQKLKDPGSFSLPCSIENSENMKALCDLGASVSLIPYSIFKRLGLGELKKTKISLQLADRSIKHPMGIMEDVFVRVGKFVIPCDFVVLDMDEDVEMPIILGRPFLATAGITIDVKAGKLTLNVGDDKVEFDLNKVVKGPSFDAKCYAVDVDEKIVKKQEENLKEVQPLMEEKEKEAALGIDVRESGITKVRETLSVSEPPRVAPKYLPPHRRLPFGLCNSPSMLMRLKMFPKGKVSLNQSDSKSSKVNRRRSKSFQVGDGIPRGASWLLSDPPD